MDFEKLMYAAETQNEVHACEKQEIQGAEEDDSSSELDTTVIVHQHQPVPTPTSDSAPPPTVSRAGQYLQAARTGRLSSAFVTPSATARLLPGSSSAFTNQLLGSRTARRVPATAAQPAPGLFLQQPPPPPLPVAALHLAKDNAASRPSGPTTSSNTPAKPFQRPLKPRDLNQPTVTKPTQLPKPLPPRRSSLSGLDIANLQTDLAQLGTEIDTHSSNLKDIAFNVLEVAQEQVGSWQTEISDVDKQIRRLKAKRAEIAGQREWGKGLVKVLQGMVCHDSVVGGEDEPAATTHSARTAMVKGKTSAKGKVSTKTAMNVSAARRLTLFGSVAEPEPAMRTEAVSALYDRWRDEVAPARSVLFSTCEVYNEVEGRLQRGMQSGSSMNEKELCQGK